ncbi:MAG: tetratricopeptide repeat protein [Paludibacter sp.]|nr:tetratricopeptide repeat protein [Paludibacter sp.]
MKRTILISLLIAVVGVLTAQVNLGVNYYLLGDYTAAKAYFEKNMNTNPSEANYYLGEIAFKEGDIAAAKTYYETGATLDSSNPYNQIGLLKLQIKGGDAKAIEKGFATIQKTDKKNVDVAVAIARAYLDNKKFEDARKQTEAALKINKKAPQICILKGDIIRAEGDNTKLGDAAAQYEMSNTYDPNYALGYVKSAQIYETINPPLALDLLKKCTETNPDYLIAYREIGTMYIDRGNYNLGIDAYKKFFSGNAYTTNDLEKMARAYFSRAYFSKDATAEQKSADYAEAQKWVDKGLSANPNHYVLNRYNMYIAAEEKNIESGLQAAKKFFSIPSPNNIPYLPSDYGHYAQLLLGDNQTEQAFAEFDKGIAVDTTKFTDVKTRSEVVKLRISTIQDAFKTATENKDFVLAAEYQEKYMAATNSYEANDYVNLWQNYYSVGNSDSTAIANMRLSDRVLNKIAATPAAKDEINADQTQETFKKYLKQYYLSKADVAVDNIIRLMPDGYTGYRLKAITQHIMNDKIEDGAAKPYYEQMVEKIFAANPDGNISDTGKKMLLEAYNYLCYHYYSVNNRDQSIEYGNKALEIDPNSANAKKILDYYAKNKK